MVKYSSKESNSITATINFSEEEIMLFTSNNTITKKLAPLSGVQKMLSAGNGKLYSYTYTTLPEFGVYAEESDFGEVVGDVIFVGENPTISSEEARFFHKDVRGYDLPDYTLYKSTWVEIPRGDADYFSMVLEPTGEWSFFPSWEELDRGCKYCTIENEELENRLLAA